MVRRLLCDHPAVTRTTSGPAGAPAADHRPHGDHDHEHDRWCGHAAVPHDGHLDFLHEGHLHHLDADHVDEVPDALDALHLPHAGHMHVHGPACGHEAIPHEDHVDYRHGAHRHAGHDVHYDEH